MSEAVAAGPALDAGSPHEAWRGAALAVPRSRRYGPEDPLSPFVAWLKTRHGQADDHARKTAQIVRRLLALYPVDEALATDPAALALGIPAVARRTGVGDALGTHGKSYRAAARRFTEWWGAGCP